MANIALQPEVAQVFREQLKSGFERYGMDAADLVDHECRKEPTGEERKELERFATGSAPCPCKALKLGDLQTTRRKRMRVAVQNALNEKRKLSHERAYSLFALLLNCRSAVAWRRAHSEDRDPLVELLFAPPALGKPFLSFTIPADAMKISPPKEWPAIALTPHGVVTLVDMLTEALRQRKLIRGAIEDTRGCIDETLRSMHDECNEALVGRLRYASGFRRVHVVTTYPPLPEKIASQTGIQRYTRRAVGVRDWKEPAPDEATEPDHLQYLQAMLWDQWQMFGDFDPVRLRNASVLPPELMDATIAAFGPIAEPAKQSEPRRGLPPNGRAGAKRVQSEAHSPTPGCSSTTGKPRKIRRP